VRWLRGLDLTQNVGSWVGDHWPLVRALLYATAVALVIAVAWLILREADLHRRRAQPSAGSKRRGDVRVRVDELLRQAGLAREQGQRLAALRLYFAAYVIALSRRGDLELREAWTNRELVERGTPSAELRASLSPLVSELDELVFGARTVTDEHLDRLEGLCRGVAR
jgi:hypothetical protein